MAEDRVTYDLDTGEMSPNRYINRARRSLVDSSRDIKQVLEQWIADPHRAARDISLNELMKAHILISDTINALNEAQRHTME